MQRLLRVVGPPAFGRAVADTTLLERIREVHERPYGMSRIHAELAAKGIRVARKRIVRLMRAAGLAGLRPSMGSVGDCQDNALCESFFAALECELVDRRGFASQSDARMAIFQFIEG